GLEMALIDGKRKLVRIGEYGFEQGEVKIRDIVRYDFTERRWLFPSPFSRRAVARMMKHDPSSLSQLAAMGMIEP
ncbi:MAG: CpaF family protein, partial [Paenibacillus sp.]|nr:CpaF family protein [Paenibacillus sp.]